MLGDFISVRKFCQLLIKSIGVVLSEVLPVTLPIDLVKVVYKYFFHVLKF